MNKSMAAASTDSLTPHVGVNRLLLYLKQTETILRRNHQTAARALAHDSPTIIIAVMHPAVPDLEV